MRIFVSSETESVKDNENQILYCIVWTFTCIGIRISVKKLRLPSHQNTMLEKRVTKNKIVNFMKD